MYGFEGKHAIITGAGRGIGRGIAERFAAEGAEVMLVGRTETTLQETAAAITSQGGSAWTYVADIADLRLVDEIVDAARRRWSTIDILINNAGIADPTPFLEISDEQWEQVIGVNLRAHFALSQRVARVMTETRRDGVILHIASIDVFGADGTYATYAASKTGLLGLNRTMALELAPYGIRVNVVCPGLVLTDMLEEAVGPEVREALMTSFDRAPMRRLMRPSEIAAACAFLASDEASAITGTHLTVDAGLTANLFIIETMPFGADREAPTVVHEPGRPAKG
jgi:NAD(P)-dependent dehydrogenase (short-subunit alcohol dehydrogenase family)